MTSTQPRADQITGGAPLACLLDSLAVTQRAFAALAGADERTVYRWLDHDGHESRRLQSTLAELIARTDRAVTFIDGQPGAPIVYRSSDDLWSAHEWASPLPASWWRACAHTSSHVEMPIYAP